MYSYNFFTRANVQINICIVSTFYTLIFEYIHHTMLWASWLCPSSPPGFTTEILFNPTTVKSLIEDEIEFTLNLLSLMSVFHIYFGLQLHSGKMIIVKMWYYSNPMNPIAKNTINMYPYRDCKCCKLCFLGQNLISILKKILMIF